MQIEAAHNRSSCTVEKSMRGNSDVKPFTISNIYNKQTTD